MLRLTNVITVHRPIKWPKSTKISLKHVAELFVHRLWCSVQEYLMFFPYFLWKNSRITFRQCTYRILLNGEREIVVKSISVVNVLDDFSKKKMFEFESLLSCRHSNSAPFVVKIQKWTKEVRCLKIFIFFEFFVFLLVVGVYFPGKHRDAFVTR